MILVDASGVSMSRPERSLFDNVSLTISSGDRLAIVGLNGSGKSTLARVLVGAVTPESGVVRRGRDVRVTMLDQSSPLPPGTVRSVLSGDGVDAWQGEAIADRLGIASLFDADVTSLSGGRRSGSHSLRRSCTTAICWCSTNRPTISTSMRSRGSKSIWPRFAVGWC